MKRSFILPITALTIIMMVSHSTNALAQSTASFIEHVEVTDEVVTFTPRQGNYVDFTMTVAGPDHFRMEQRFSGQETPHLPIKTEHGPLPDGSYVIEMSARPKISDEHRAALDAARQKGDRYAIRMLMNEIGINPAAMVYSTSLGIAESKFINPEGDEVVETTGENTKAVEKSWDNASRIQSVQLTGRRWDAAYLPNEPNVTGTAVQPATLGAASSEDALPFAQDTPDPAAAWYEATFQNTAPDGTPLTYQGFLRPVVTDSQGKLFEVYLRKADGLTYSPWQQGSFQADEGVFRAANHAHTVQPFDYLTENSPETNEAPMTLWHTGLGSIQGSLCLGTDCAASESFGFDTFRLKENNLRIHFNDTSVGSFPTNDWRIVINGSASGGSSYFSIYDADTGRDVIRVFAGARSNALTVDSQGDLGLGTTTPATDIDIKVGNTPTLRLQQDGSSGFTPQTWDVAGNEAGFFIRDATSGSTLPFRIMAGGAPSQSLVIDADGEVGIGAGTNPDVNLHIEDNASSGTDNLLKLEYSGSTSTARNLLNIINNGSPGIRYQDTDNGNVWRSRIHPLNSYQLIEAGDTDIELSLAANGDLTVGGNLTATTTGSSIPDYVFEEDYALMPLEEVKAFISERSHLPNIPSVEEIEAAGGQINMTQMQLRLLEKIEELTLYTIEQQETIQKQQETVTRQQHMLEALQERLTALEELKKAGQQ